MAVPKDTPTEKPKQFNLGYLFFVTTMIALGFGLCASTFHPAASGIGMSLVLFWLSRGIFVLSTHMPKVAREIVFLIGLPLFIASMIFLLLALLSIAVDLFG